MSKKSAEPVVLPGLLVASENILKSCAPMPGSSNSSNRVCPCPQDACHSQLVKVNSCFNKDGRFAEGSKDKIITAEEINRKED